MTRFTKAAAGLVGIIGLAILYLILALQGLARIATRAEGEARR